MKPILLLVLIVIGCATPALAQTEGERLQGLETRVSSLEQKVQRVGGTGAGLFLFGAFCALWAQNTGRNAWLWFFLGFLFSVIAVLVLLYKNSNDPKPTLAAGERPFDRQNPPQQ